MGPTDTTQAAWSNGKRSVFLVVFKQPGANVINTVEAIKKTLNDLEASIPPTIHVKVLSDRTTTIRASVHDVEFTLLLTIALVVMVIFVFPAQPLGDDHSEHHRAARAARRLRADVGGRLQPRQSVADGVHDRGRLRRRRRDRDAREHHAPHRGGGKAVRGGAQGLRRDRLHHHLDLGLAGRGADPASDDERHHRPPVPRILGHDRHDDRRLGDRFADADADDGVALPQEPRRGASRPAL